MSIYSDSNPSYIAQTRVIVTEFDLVTTLNLYSKFEVSIVRLLLRTPGPVPYVEASFYQICRIKASAHSFKRFTSRLLKLSFSLSMHLLPQMNVMLDFI